MKSKISSNKSFGVIFSIFFLILGVYPLLNHKDINIIFVLLSLLFLFLGLINSKILTPLNTNWIKFGIFLGKNNITISHVVHLFYHSSFDKSFFVNF